MRLIDWFFLSFSNDFILLMPIFSLILFFMFVSCLSKYICDLFKLSISKLLSSFLIISSAISIFFFIVLIGFTFNKELNSKDIDRLISSGYLNNKVLIQIKKDINESYDGLEGVVENESINLNRKFLINYKRINKAIYNLEDIKKNSVINGNGLEDEQVKIDLQKKIEIIQNSREEFNEKIDKLIDLKAPK